jgi:cyclopropane-fatty-acyl-phospholipid synthase
MFEVSKDERQSGTVVRAGAWGKYLSKRVFDILRNSGIPCELTLPDGRTESFGEASPQFQIILKNSDALKAISSLNEMRIAESYLRGDIDLEGDLIQSFELRNMLVDSSPLVSVWRFLEPLVFGQIRTNRRAISSHYDVDADFFMSFLDRKTPSYTQGVYIDDNETLEDATIRKFNYCYEALNLKPGDHILDIGPGWGAWLEYASARGVKCTGITISQESADYLRRKAANLRYDWNIELFDLLEYHSKDKFDAIVIMGVIEHLPQYDLVVEKFRALIKPGGRIFLDGSASEKKYDVAKFLVKYIYPGNHSYMVLHDFMKALTNTPLRIVELYNDRHSYFLTARQWARNLDSNYAFIRDRFGENVYRRFRLYLWGTAYQFQSGGLDCYRMVIVHPTWKVDSKVV